MYRLAFSIEHDGCWLTEATQRFPGLRCVLRSSLPRSGHGRFITGLRATTPEQLASARDFILHHPHVRKCEVLEEVDCDAYLAVDARLKPSVTSVLMGHGAFLLAPTIVEAGEEHWTVGLVRHDDAKQVMRDVATQGRVRMELLVRDTFPEYRLSDAQKRILRVAMVAGYYDFPRRVSVTQLARKMGLSKSTFREHLRKAEAKVIVGLGGTI